MSVPLRWPEDEITEPVVAAPNPMRNKAGLRTRRRRRLFVLCSTALIVGVTAVVAGRAALLSRPLGMELRQLPAPKGSQVEAGALTLERKLGYITVTGSVANLSNRTYSNIEAVVELLDSHQQTVQMESGLIAFASLPAHQSAPFMVETTDNPKAVACRVRFKQLLGPVLN